MAVVDGAVLPRELRYIQYDHSLEAEYLPAIRSLISKDLSEPYSIYVYRYFLCQWAHLCFMVRPLAFNFSKLDTYDGGEANAAAGR